MDRAAIHALAGHPYGGDASLLHNLLLADHGHIPGKRFAIVPDAMRGSGLLNMSQNRVYRARDVLVELGLLAKHRPTGVKRAIEYQLRRISSGAEERGLVSYIASGGECCH